ncbi:MAG TPA: DUF3515 domain-containing protein [Mycobacterium sp.]|nr:DUF3515 domain-containing protein [Mycobacterium sp.]
MADADDPPRVALIAALVTAIATAGAVLAIAVAHQRPRQPVAIAAVAAPHAADPACRALLAALPQRLGDYQRATVAPPAPDGAAGWTQEGGDAGEPVVLRCGLDRPTDFTVGSPIQVVDAVQWFAVRSDDRSTWYTVDRPVYVALTLPPGSGPAPIQQLSGLIDATVPAVPINPGPAS